MKNKIILSKKNWIDIGEKAGWITSKIKDTGEMVVPSICMFCKKELREEPWYALPGTKLSSKEVKEVKKAGMAVMQYRRTHPETNMTIEEISRTLNHPEWITETLKQDENAASHGLCQECKEREYSEFLNSPEK